MRTRTLLLLAVGCGLAILVAGGIQLLRVSDSPSGNVDLVVGEAARAGDATVTVLGATEDVPAGQLRVEISVAGVDDPGGLAGFHLVVPAQALDPLAPNQPDDCDGFTVAQRTCTLRFDVSATKGTARVLLWQRGEDRRRWDLAGLAPAPSTSV